jgi:putative membrane protein
LAIAITFPKEIHMQKRQILNRMLGIAVLAMLFGASSVQAQSGSTSGSAGQDASSSAQSGSSSGSSSASSSKDAGGKSLSKSDQNIMREMAMSNLAEIETGKIALSQSKNDQVRNFAQKMIDDHQQAQKDLEQLAQSKGVTLPTEPDKKHQAAAKKLSSLEGDKFDKQYMKQGGLSDHRNTHRLLQRAQTRATDPDLKALAAKMEPIVSQHLTMAQDVSGGKASASGSQGPAGTSASGSSSGSTGSSSSSGSSGSDKSGVSGTSGSSNSTSPSKQ